MASKSLEDALDEIEYLVGELELPTEVEQMANVIVRRWSEQNRLQSRPAPVNAAAAVVVACKRNNLPYTTRDVGALMRSDESPKYIARAETDMVSELGFDDVSVTTPDDYLERFAEEAELDSEVVDLAGEVIDLAQEGRPNVFSGRSPSAGSAAALWIAARLTGNRVTQDAMADIAETTTVTLRDMANSIVVGVLESGTDMEDLATTDEIDGRLNQRIERSRREIETEA